MKALTQEQKDEFQRLVAEKRAQWEQKNGLAPGSATPPEPKYKLADEDAIAARKIEQARAAQSTGNLYTPTASPSFSEFTAQSFPEFTAQQTNNTGYNPPEFTAQKTTTTSSTYIAKTILPKLVDINYTQTVDQLKTESNFFDSSAVQGLEKEAAISLDYYTALQSSDIIASLTDFYKNLNDKLSTLKNDFVDFWVKRFYLTPEPIKTLVSQNLNINNDSFYTELSDSIGLLVNSGALIDDATTPFTDYTTDLYTAPNTLPVQVRNKISKTSLAVTYDLSRNTTILMRNNLKGINLPTRNTNPYANSTTNPAHGTNLITDINTYNIIKTNLNSYYTKLNNNFKKIFSYIEYNSNINNFNGYNPRETGIEGGSNQQLITRDYTFSLMVSRFTQSVDLLLRKTKNLLSYKTNENTIGNITTTNT